MSGNLTRIKSAALDHILGESFKVLDKGFIRVIDYMGSDKSITRAARVSYGVGTACNSDDNSLIRYMLRQGHSTPFESCVIQLHVKAPIYVFRQWIRHRASTTNELSGRYSVMEDCMQSTDAGEWRYQSSSNKQGSSGFCNTSVGEELSFAEKVLQGDSFNMYNERLDAGISREQARKDLPLSTYSEMYWKIDIHNLFHFLELRMNSHAQKEIRDYANIIGTEIVSKWVPMAWDAFNVYRLKACTFSAEEGYLLNTLISENKEQMLAHAGHLGWVSVEGAFGHERKLVKKREYKEFESKLESIGIELSEV